jgi:hypothetical protein
LKTRWSIKIVMVKNGSTMWTHEPYYLAHFDPNAEWMYGDIQLTREKSKALTFTNIEEALQCYHATSTKHPKDSDGNINQPLKRFVVDFVHNDESERIWNNGNQPRSEK